MQGVRLKKLYESWEDNPDIGFVVMKVVDLVSLFPVCFKRTL